MEEHPFRLEHDFLVDVLAHISNEIYVVDRNMNVIYVNNACTKHYGLLPSEMIGKNHMDFVGSLWYPTVVPQVLKEKRPMRIRQVTYTGESIIATAVPVLDDQGAVDMVVCVTEEVIQRYDMVYDPLQGETIYPDECNAPQPPPCTCLSGTGPGMERILSLAEKCAKHSASVLLLGESGTGKTLLAEHIHMSGNRKDGPFHALNCATMPPQLLEVELFGCAPNAFTDAPPKGRIGLLEASCGGTLFLDEIGELPLATQAKFLGLLETKTYIPVGDTKSKSVDVRIIAATNRNLEELVKKRLFREDLYWRFNVVEILIPPLRDRSDEIPALVAHFLALFNEKYHRNKVIDSQALQILCSYPWPGNIRQLKNMMERLTSTVVGESITAADIPLNMKEHLGTSFCEDVEYTQFRERCAREIVRDAYAQHPTSRKLAQQLKVSKTTAVRLIQKYVTEGDSLE